MRHNGKYTSLASMARVFFWCW